MTDMENQSNNDTKPDSNNITLSFNNLVEQCRSSVKEIMPWDMADLLNDRKDIIILDVRETREYTAMHIQDSIHIPRGILEPACEFGYEETNPIIANARDKEIIIVCRSGNRSLLAAKTMQYLGYKNVTSLQTGLRGWNDYELPLFDDDNNPVNMGDADEFFTSMLRPEQVKK